jgi:cytochrome c-type biogenesis protein CcmF
MDPTPCSLAVCAFALAISVRELIEPVVVRTRKGEGLATAARTVLTRTRRRVGAHIAHIGVIITTIAIALSSGYQQTHDRSLRVGETEEIGDFAVTFTGARMDKEAHRDSLVGQFDITRAGVPIVELDPRLNFYKRMREPVGTPAVYSTPAGDLYLSLQKVEQDGSQASIRALYTPAVMWVWVGPIVIALGTGLAGWPARRSSARSQTAATEERRPA